MTSVLVLGGSGMLGSALVATLAADPALDVYASARAPLLDPLRERLPGARWLAFDAEADPLEALPGGVSWVINAIGVIRHHMLDGAAASVSRAIAVNALFPHRLAVWASEAGARVLQIATDCVFSGARGGYSEDDRHDALDAYGKTKSLGEVRGPGFFHLRCSIVGPEAARLRQGGGRSLLEWLLGQAPGGCVDGYTDHRWNGVTTLHFARVARAIVRAGDDLDLPPLQHLVPADAVSKATLLRLFAREYGRDDLTIRPRPAAHPVDRTLRTAAPARNEALWRAAGHPGAPTIEDMVRELAQWPHPLRDLALSREARA